MKKVFIFQEIWVKVNVLKRFKTFTDCHIKTRWSLKWRAFLKIPITVFRRIHALSVGIHMKTLRKSVFKCYDKNQLKFCCKSYWEKEAIIHFYCLFHESRFSGICTIIELKWLNWLCKYMKNVRSSQPGVSVNFCTEFSKAQVFPCEYREIYILKVIITETIYLLAVLLLQ